MNTIHILMITNFLTLVWLWWDSRAIELLNRKVKRVEEVLLFTLIMSDKEIEDAREKFSREQKEIDKKKSRGKSS